MPPYLRPVPGGVELAVKLQPRASREEIEKTTAEFGVPLFAIESTPFSWRCVLNSSLILYPGSPVPRSGAFGFLDFGSPPWIMKPLMMRWKPVPSKKP